MSSPCPFCPDHRDIRNQRLASHFYNDHKYELLQNYEANPDRQQLESTKKLSYYSRMKKPYYYMTYVLNGVTYEKWLCFASGISCSSRRWMENHNEKNGRYASLHMEMVKQLLKDQEKILAKGPATKKSKPTASETTAEAVSQNDSEQYIARIQQLEAQIKRLEKQVASEKRSNLLDKHLFERHQASVPIFCELLTKHYGEHGDGFKPMYDAIYGAISNAYCTEHYNEDDEAYDEDEISQAEKDARAIYITDYLGEPPMSKEAVLEEHATDTGCDRVW